MNVSLTLLVLVIQCASAMQDTTVPSNQESVYQEKKVAENKLDLDLPILVYHQGKTHHFVLKSLPIKPEKEQENNGNAIGTGYLNVSLDSSLPIDFVFDRVIERWHGLLHDFNLLYGAFFRLKPLEYRFEFERTLEISGSRFFEIRAVSFNEEFRFLAGKVDRTIFWVHCQFDSSRESGESKRDWDDFVKNFDPRELLNKIDK